MNIWNPRKYVKKWKTCNDYKNMKCDEKKKLGDYMKETLEIYENGKPLSAFTVPLLKVYISFTFLTVTIIPISNTNYVAYIQNFKFYV